MSLDTSSIVGNIAKMTAEVESGAYAITEKGASDVKSYGQSNAPWQDRTGNARQGLNAKAVHETGNHQIVFYHQVPYGPWLEIRRGGAYAIILPTIRKKGPEVMGSLGGLFEGF